MKQVCIRELYLGHFVGFQSLQTWTHKSILGFRPLVNLYVLSVQTQGNEFFYNVNRCLRQGLD